jgi:uncharacterized protein YraI
MRKSHEKLLMAALAGLIIAAAAGFAVQPANAAGYGVEAPARVHGVDRWDHLNVRKWPASHSQKVGQLAPLESVWIERCVVAPQGGSDWCLIENGTNQGWVNARYLRLIADWDI